MFPTSELQEVIQKYSEKLDFYAYKLGLFEIVFSRSSYRKFLKENLGNSLSKRKNQIFTNSELDVKPMSSAMSDGESSPVKPKVSLRFLAKKRQKSPKSDTKSKLESDIEKIDNLLDNQNKVIQIKD